MKIAVILTCFNRKQQTLSCLKSLFEARDNYQPKIDLHIFLTDDGCTDGTADVVRESFPAENITILQGDGNLFWAGGMRFAWKEALKKHDEWDAYLLLNDDTDILLNMFDEILNTETYCKNKYGKEGIISGITCSKSDHTKMTYGGDVWVNKFLAKQKRLKPSTEPQMCDMTNANILFVPKTITDKIGTFDEHFIHGVADYDYTMTARAKDIPVLVTANFCGACDNDHDAYDDQLSKILSMTFSERKKYFSFPPRSGKDHLHFIKKHLPLRFPLVWMGTKLKHYTPEIYCWLHGIRKGFSKTR